MRFKNTRNRKAWNSFLFLFAVSILITACKGKDPVIPNEEELITTVSLTLISEDGKDTLDFTFEDLDGDGGEEPLITATTLKANTTYNASLSLMNKSVTPAQNITEEVIEEGTLHQLFYVVKDADLTVTYMDKDQNGNPLGIKTVFKTGKATDGELKVILRHEPIKPNDGNPATAEGETDIEVSFVLFIE